MKGMILAAGRGIRMGELTQRVPKPLLQVDGQYLILYALYAMREAGIRDIIINVSYRAQQIQDVLGDGQQYGLSITYVVEPEPLETGGGIFNALAFFENQPFIAMSSDIITDFSLNMLPHSLPGLAHLVLVDNPDFHAEGDFGIENGCAKLNVLPKFTFANIGLYHPDLFLDVEPGCFPLHQLLFPAIASGLVTAEKYQGPWRNIGSPAQL